MDSESDKHNFLRNNAEAWLAHKPATDITRLSKAKLLHELQVHQAELEMQNDELRRSQVILEESRDRYFEYFDFASVGYLTLSREGIISEVNLTCATILGVDRRKLVSRRFTPFVVPDNQDRWRLHFVSTLNDDVKHTCDLVVQRADGSSLDVQMDCLRRIEDDNKLVVRVVMTDITERKAAEAALRESERRRYLLEQKGIVQTSLDGFWMVDAKNWQILDVNDNYCRMVGYSREEVLAMSIQELAANESPDEVEAHIKRIREIGYDRFETRHRHKQGHLVDFEVSVSNSEMDGGVNFAFFCDITERKRAVSLLQRTLKETDDLYNNAACGYHSLDKDGLILRINDTELAWLGYTRDEVVGKMKLIDFFTPKSIQTFHKTFPLLIEHGFVHDIEIELIRKNGTVLIGLINATAIYDANLNFVMSRSTLVDITALKASEKTLWQKTQLLDSIVENIPNMIFLKNASDLRFEMFNKAGEKLLGYSRRDLLGKGNYDLWPREQADWFTAEDRKALASLSSTEIPEEPIKTASGETRYLQTWKVALRDNTGEPKHLLGISVDITDRKRADQQLHELTEHLQTVREEEKAYIAREIHDELGSKLAAIKMDAYWLARKLAAAHDREDPMLERAESMVSVLNDTLKSLRRIITDLRPTILDDLGLLEAIKWQADQFKKNTGIECRVICHCSEGCESKDKLDGKLSITLFRIFQESLTNVTRHSGASKVEVDFYQDDKEVVLSISDNGCGLPEGHSIASTSFGIRGMRERVEQLEGKIEFNNLPEGGLNITVTFPLFVETLKDALTQSESRYHALFENMRDGYAYCKMLYDDHNRPVDFIYLNVNEVFGRLTGLKNVVGQPVSKIIPGIRRQYPELFEIYGRVASTGVHEVFDFDMPLLGKSFNISVYCPEKNHFIAVFSDITKQKQVERDLRVAATAFETQEGMIVTDANSVILRVNSAFTGITGYTAAEAVGQTPRLLNSGHHDAVFYASMWESLLRTGAWQGEIWNRRKNGEIYPEYLTINSVKGDNGEITNYVAMMSDITIRKASEEQIHYLAYYDQLTNLPNRRLLIDRLGQTMVSQKRSRCYSALMFLDLDNFKPINDTYGHGVGDLLLVEVARRIGYCVRKSDTVSRIGGDEFVVMLSELNTEKSEATTQALAIAEKIRITLAEPYLMTTRLDDKAERTIEHHCSSSIGVVFFIGQETNIEDILKCADAAMYKAKKDGRNVIRLFDSMV